MRVRFGALATVVCVPLERQAEAESFTATVNRAIEGAKG